MKKALIAIVSICVIILSGYYIVLNANRSTKNQDIQIENKSTQDKPTKQKDTKEVKIGDIIMNVPTSTEVNFENNKMYISIKGIYAEDGDSFKRTQVDSKDLKISYFKDDNKEKLTTQEWFDGSEEQNFRWRDIPGDEKYININNNNMYLLRYFSPAVSSDLKYYDKERGYISKNTDIYEIVNYRKSDSPDIKLSPEETDSIKNYEKIVDEIINSIRFES